MNEPESTRNKIYSKNYAITRFIVGIYNLGEIDNLKTLPLICDESFLIHFYQAFIECKDKDLLVWLDNTVEDCFCMGKELYTTCETVINQDNLELFEWFNNSFEPPFRIVYDVFFDHRVDNVDIITYYLKYLTNNPWKLESIKDTSDAFRLFYNMDNPELFKTLWSAVRVKKIDWEIRDYIIVYPSIRKWFEKEHDIMLDPKDIEVGFEKIGCCAKKEFHEEIKEWLKNILAKQKK